MHRFKENVRVDAGYMAIGTSTTATVTTGTAVSLAKYNNFVGVVQGVVTPGAGPLTAYITEATFATGVFNQATPLATVTIASATTPYLGYAGTIEVRSEQLSDGHNWVRVEVLPSSGTGNLISISNQRFNSRFPQASLPS
jgi:hypothetical protein